MKRRFLLFLVTLVYAFNMSAENNITRITDDGDTDKRSGFAVTYAGLNNSNGLTQINLIIRTTQVPLELSKVEWKNCDTIRQTLQPAKITIPAQAIKEKSAIWNIQLEFAYANKFSKSDELRIYTNQGVIKLPMSQEGRYRKVIQKQQHEFDTKLRQLKSESTQAWHSLTIILCGVVIATIIIGFIIRYRLQSKQKQLKELATLMAERTNLNHDLRNKVNELYNSRLDTLNMLCNEYFEKHDSEKIRLSLYNEVEKHILRLRSKQSLKELEAVVNTYVDNIIVRLRQQMPDMKTADLNFLIYLFAGFSPRAICIFSDIKIKNFYNRRSRLKERILNSDAPDREWFVSKM